MEELHQLLANNSTEKFYIAYKGGLANHMAQGLISLHRLGAHRGRMQQFVEWYQTRLESPTGATAEGREDKPAEDVEKLLGARRNFYQLVQHYRAQLEDKFQGDVKRLVSSVFPAMSKGMMGAAFHGLLLLGYGCAAMCPRTVCEGLAYMHYSYSPVVVRDEELLLLGTGTKDITEVLQDIRSNKDVLQYMDEKRQSGELHVAFSRRTKAMVSEKGDLLMDILGQIKVPVPLDASGVTQDDVIKLCKWAIDCGIYVYTKCENKNDFFFLHGVTSSWALMQVVSLLDSPLDGARALQTWLVCLLAAHIMQGSLPLERELCIKSTDLTDWATIVETALAEDRDEHIYKLVQVAKERVSETGDENKQLLYKCAANTALQNKLYFFEFS